MSWIWVPRKKYPDCQASFANVNAIPREEQEKYKYCVAEFKREFTFEKNIKKLTAVVSGDSFFHLYVNGEFAGLGPVASGGDFLCRRCAPKHYSNRYEFELCGNSLSLFARVRLLPQVLTDYSRLCGGFLADYKIEFEDGGVFEGSTDNSWLCRINSAYKSYSELDGSLALDGFCAAEEKEDVWNAEQAPIPMLDFSVIYEKSFKLKAGEKLTENAVFDKIYGVYPCVKASSACSVNITTRELDGQVSLSESVKFAGAGEWLAFRMHSAGQSDIELEAGGGDVEITVKFIASWYPVTGQGVFKCSDKGLEKAMEVCLHTLKICRQTLHLDSTKHQELLACTGDYYIESLITAYAFGDMRLAEFDVMRTADWIKDNNGVMFHTTYSLIFVQMLRDVYYVTGRRALLEYCESALDILLARFESYLGESGVIETPPDYMFVDWTVIDGYSMHHPPKALGQTVLNAFYYEALGAAACVYAFLGQESKKLACLANAEKLKASFNREFFDEEKDLYFDGKNDPCGGTDNHFPINSEKRYFSQYPNILAALYGLADGERAKSILKECLSGKMQDIQPYFMHYMLCALRKNGLFTEYGFAILDRWKPLVEECDKGLKEGWFAPEKGYSFDHSHAWGGTIAYQLPSAISGMKILSPGMKKLSFAPCLYGLGFAEIEIPVEGGRIRLSLKKGEKPLIAAPEGYEINITEDVLL